MTDKDVAKFYWDDSVFRIIELPDGQFEMRFPRTKYYWIQWPDTTLTAPEKKGFEFL